MSLGNSFLSPVRGGRRGGYTHCTTGLVLLSIFNIRMKKKGWLWIMVMKSCLIFFMYHGMLLAVMEKRYKKIEKRRLEVSVGTTARAHEVG